MVGGVKAALRGQCRHLLGSSLWLGVEGQADQSNQGIDGDPQLRIPRDPVSGEEGELSLVESASSNSERTPLSTAPRRGEATGGGSSGNTRLPGSGPREPQQVRCRQRDRETQTQRQTL